MDRVHRAAEALKAKQIPFEEKAPMSRHTTFQIGGEAALFCVPEDTGQLAAALAAARQAGLPHMLLGNGSNLLFADDGYPGMVIATGRALGCITVAGQAVTAGAGVPLRNVCEAAREAHLAGLEFAYGIPGSVGGAVYMNAGAYGGEMRGVVHSVTVLDEALTTREVPVEALELHYRTSVFHRRPWCILSARFGLEAGDVELIAQKMRENMQKRADKQPLELPSAGSAFKRPNGAFAGELIDRCGLRGYRIGGAAISEKHCGFIVNLGGATCADVLMLAAHVQRVVEEKTGYRLEREICVVEAVP